MSFRFRRSKNLFPGVRLNVGKKGPSVRIGGKGFGYTFGYSGQRISAGVSGTGLSYSKKIGGKRRRHANVADTARSESPVGGLIVIAVIIGGLIWWFA